MQNDTPDLTPHPAEYHSPVAPQGDIVARGSKEYRLKRYAIVALFLLFGLWCIRDGYFAWPKANAEAAAKGEKLPHPGLDVPFNRVLGAALPPLAILMLLFAHYNSRGEVRLSNNTLHVPGHPPIPLDSIHPLDESNQKKWDRKGLAHFTYTLPGTSQTKKFRLDDFVYDQKPIDDIYERIRAVTGETIPNDQTVDPHSSDA